MWCNQLRRQDFFSPHSILRLKQKFFNNWNSCNYSTIRNWTVQHHLKNEEKTNLAFWADCTTCSNRRKETKIQNSPQVLLLISMLFFFLFLNSFWTSIYSEKRLCLYLFFSNNATAPPVIGLWNFCHTI